MMMNMKRIKHIKLGKLNNLYINKCNKFKSITISVVYKQKYSYEKISANNILAKYLGNCSFSYPSIELLNKKVESLYGGVIGIKINYVNELLTFDVYANIINPKFFNDQFLFEETVKLLYEIIYNPYIVDKTFNEEIFEICKENCLIDAKSNEEYDFPYIVNEIKKKLVDDKKSALCAFKMGDYEVIEKFNNKNIYKYYKDIIKSPFDIYVSGDVTYKNVISIIKKYYSHKKVKNNKLDVFSLIPKKEYEPIIINKDVKQAKLVILYRIPILFNDEKTYTFRLLKVILSGTLSSKFNKVIREEKGLCYSISTSYSAYYGYFLITTAVSNDNVLKVINEVKNQINLVKDGNITIDEINIAKKIIINDLKGMDDTLFETLNMIKVYHNFNKEFDLDDVCNKYLSISKDDIVNACKELTYLTYGVITKEKL